LVERCRVLLGGDGSREERNRRRLAALETLQARAKERRAESLRRVWGARPISRQRLSAELGEAVKGKPWSGVPGPGWEVTGAGQVPSAGSGGGSAGLGLAMGVAMGAALAQKDAGRFFVQMVGDGELLYTSSSLW